ncbi:MAG: hypothetical protein R2761_06300 [Acidimicrobiales bacterium]
MARWRLLPMAAILTVADCGFGGDGLDQVHEQNRVNLAYPADDAESTLHEVYERLTAAAGTAFGPPAATTDQFGVRRDTWCRPAGTTARVGAAGGPACDATGADAGADAGELVIVWNAAEDDDDEPVDSIEVDHRSERYQFTFETLYDDHFELAAPGLGSFSIVAARYALDVDGTNLPTVYSQPLADSARADLLAYLASPEGLAAQATAKLETLRAQTQRWLDLPGLRRQFGCETKPGIEGQVTRCQQAELSADERNALRTTVDDIIDGRIAEVEANAAALHPLLVEATLSDRCPDCWG